MKTTIYDLSKEDKNKIYKEASNIIKNGGNVVFPTETVYGLGANSYNKKAVESIFKIKNRPQDNPLIVHISDFNMLKDVVREVPENAKILMEKFFPGPLTLVMKKSDKIPNVVTNGLDTVGVRMPSLKSTREFISKCSVPIAAPSANISGRPSLTAPKHIVEELNGKVDMILLEGSSDIGVESTVLDVSSDIPKLLRPGGVGIYEIEKTLNIKIKGSTKDDVLKPKSPGMKYAHYRPNKKVIVLMGEEKNIIKYIQKEKKNDKIGVIGFNSLIKQIDDDIIKISLGDNEKSACNKLFSSLRELDTTDIDIIYAQGLEIKETKELDFAFMNRLLKSANSNKINTDTEV